MNIFFDDKLFKKSSSLLKENFDTNALMSKMRNWSKTSSDSAKFTAYSIHELPDVTSNLVEKSKQSFLGIGKPSDKNSNLKGSIPNKFLHSSIAT